MFKWLMFWKNDDEDFYQCVTDLKLANMPNKDPDISEPVTSFLKCFESTPKRFKLVRSDTDSRRLPKYQFNDLETNESWKITIYTGGYHGCKIHDTDWMTSDEQELIVKTISNYYIKRKLQRLSILSKRHARKMEKERSRLTAIYKED